MKISTIILWMISVILAFSIGFFTKPTDLNDLLNNNHSDDTPTQIELDTPDRKVGKIQHENSEISQTPSDKEIDVVAEIRSLLGNGQTRNFASIAKSYALVSDLKREEVIKALDKLKYGLSKSDGLVAFNLVISRYAELDPNGAINYIDNNIISIRAKQSVTTSVISIWSNNDPTSAYHWLLDNSEENDDGFAPLHGVNFVPVFSGLAKQDMDDAFSKLSELADDRSVLMATMGIAGALSTQEEFVSFYQKSKAMKTRNATDSLIMTWANRDPRETIDWLDTMEPGEEKTKLQKKVFETWIHSEPNDAADWYLASASEQSRQSSVEKIIDRWSYNSPRSALSWLDQQQDIDTQKSTKKLLNKAAYGDTKFALDNLYRLETDEDKKSVSYSIYYNLKRKNKTEAANFLNSTPYKKYLVNMESKTSKKRSK